MGLLDGGALFWSNLYILVQILSIANGSQIFNFNFVMLFK
jgi:hypothetical protein